MKVTEIIQEELGQELEKIGFQSAFKERYIWPYEREKDGIKQRITIITDRYEKNISGFYLTQALMGRERKSFDILYRSKVQNSGNFGDIKTRKN